MPAEKPKINCFIFQKQEPIVKEIIDKINKAKELKVKIKYARELLEEVNVFLLCPEFEETNLNCRNCRIIATLRKKVADLIIKTQKLI